MARLTLSSDSHSSPATATKPAPIRVTIVQPALAKYRVPVFRALARRPGIDLRVVYGNVAGLPNVEAAGFDAVSSRRWEGKILGRGVMIHGAEWKYCSRQLTDVVVLRWSPRSLVSLAGIMRSRRNGVGTVLWGHGYSKTERSWWVTIRDWIGRRADALVFYDPRTRDAYAAAGWNPEQLFVAINCIDQKEIELARDWWRNRPDELQKFRLANGIAAGPVVLFVSRLQPANRVDLLIKATAELCRIIPHLKTVIIGNGSDERSRLINLAREMGVSNSVVFLDGIYDEFKLAPWFLSADVFCYPENIGLSLIHSFGYGLPVVTSDDFAVQNPEIIALEHGVNGRLYNHGNIASLAAEIRHVIEGRKISASMGEAAQRTTQTTFTISNMVDGLEAAIRFAAARSLQRA